MFGRRVGGGHEVPGVTDPRQRWRLHRKRLRRRGQFPGTSLWELRALRRRRSAGRFLDSGCRGSPISWSRRAREFLDHFARCRTMPEAPVGPRPRGRDGGSGNAICRRPSGHPPPPPSCRINWRLSCLPCATDGRGQGQVEQAPLLVEREVERPALTPRRFSNYRLPTCRARPGPAAARAEFPELPPVRASKSSRIACPRMAPAGVFAPTTTTFL